MKKLIPFVVLALALGASLVPLATGAPTQTVRVTEVDGRITLSARPKAGSARFVVRNAGDEGHDFWVRGGGQAKRTPVLGVGRTSTLTIRLKRGVTYRFWCGVSDHAQEGMSGSFRAR